MGSPRKRRPSETTHDNSILKRKRGTSWSKTPNPQVSEGGSNASRKRGCRATEDAAERQSEQGHLCDRCK
ncbi:hypothetical protein GJ744_011412 [Endocarpon pusillum]|uniref:Uncharacterized protein n=1 Tax=Endocarpon pusillum TaxID=364733 RepID=A0A8H7E2Z7_9EURO|nr:hypothetical protein GJ744_011412 [Endocarpon pusillum]